MLQVNVPGKCMIAGEYSVLKGGRALACTVDAWLTVKLSESAEHSQIISDYWQKPLIFKKVSDLQNWQHEPLLQTLEYCEKNILNTQDKSFYTLEVNSELDPTFGLGSSSALTIAVLKAFARQHMDEKKTFETALQLQRIRQKQASGYDIATQNFGGVTEYKMGERMDLSSAQNFVRKLNNYFHILVGGNGAPTSETVQSTSEFLEQQKLWDALNHCNENLVDECLKFLSCRHTNLSSLVNSAKQVRQIFETHNHFPINVLENVESLAGFDKDWTFKTSGAGGEDALILIASPKILPTILPKFSELGWKKFEKNWSERGAFVQ